MSVRSGFGYTAPSMCSAAVLCVVLGGFTLWLEFGVFVLPCWAGSAFRCLVQLKSSFTPMTN
jgi:hypothetical protein